MKFDYGKILKTAARASFKIVSKALIFGFFGLFLNIVYLVFLFPEMGAILNRMGGIPAANAGGIGAMITLPVMVIEAWPVTLLVLGFSGGFPMAYLVLGKKHGVTQALHDIIGENREFIAVYFIDRLLESVRKISGVGEQTGTAVSRLKAVEHLPVYLKKLDTMPRPLPMVYRLVISRIDFGGMLTKILEHGEDELNLEVLSDIAHDKVGDYISDNAFVPDLRWFWILLGANTALFVLLKIVI